MGHYCENHILAAIQKSMSNAQDKTVTIKESTGTCLNPGGCVFSDKKNGYALTYDQVAPEKVEETPTSSDSEITDTTETTSTSEKATEEEAPKEASIPAS